MPGVSSSSHHIKCASEPGRARVCTRNIKYIYIYAMIPTEAINIVGRPRRASIFYGIYTLYTLLYIMHTYYTIYI